MEEVRGRGHGGDFTAQALLEDHPDRVGVLCVNYGSTSGRGKKSFREVGRDGAGRAGGPETVQ